MSKNASGRGRLVVKRIRDELRAHERQQTEHRQALHLPMMEQPGVEPSHCENLPTHKREDCPEYPSDVRTT